LRQAVDRGERVVLFNTGSGLKYTDFFDKGLSQI
jgi:threonine synthase